MIPEARLQEIDSSMGAVSDDVADLVAEVRRQREALRRLRTIETDAKAETFQGHLMHRQWYSPREVWMLLRALGATDDAIRAALTEESEEGEAV